MNEKENLENNAENQSQTPELADAKDQAQSEMTGRQELTPSVDEGLPAAEDALAEEDKEKVDALNAQINALMKKYKLTMYGVVACIALYVVALFWIKNNYLVLIICVPMIALAFINSRYAKQIRKLAEQRAALQKSAAPKQTEDGQPAAHTVDESVVSQMSSLNQLPKSYTVVDDANLKGTAVKHVVVSPYEIAIVGDPDGVQAMEEMLGEMGISVPVVWYDPDEELETLAPKLQANKEAVLTEPQIMTVLYKVTGLK